MAWSLYSDYHHYHNLLTTVVLWCCLCGEVTEKEADFELIGFDSA